MSKKDLVATLVVISTVLSVLILGDTFDIFRVRMVINIPLLIIGLLISLTSLTNIIVRQFLFPLSNELKNLLIYTTLGISLLTTVAAFIVGHTNFTWIGIAAVFILITLLINNAQTSPANKVLTLESESNKIDFPLIAIVAVFIIFRLYILIRHQGSYLDEYLHIFTGASWFNQNFHEIYKGIEYYRGIYLTAISGLSYQIFGFSFFAQKAIPLLLSGLNFFLFWKFSKKYLKDRWLHNAALLAYAITPILIFNATYIRTYLFFETFAYVSFYLIQKVLSSYEAKEWQKFSIFSLLTVLFAGFVLFTKDVESMLFLLIIGLGGLFYILFTMKSTIKFDFMQKLPIKHWHIILLALLVLPFLDVTKYLDLFLNGQLTHGDGGVQKYIQFFFIDHLLFTIYFVALWAMSFFEKNLERKIVYAVLAAMFVFHNIITPDYRNLRGIFYFFPFFIMGTMMVIEQVFTEKAILKIVLAIVIALSPLLSAQQYLVNGPSIPKEIDYYPFSEYYQVVKNQCKDRKILSMMHSNYISNFYGVQPHALIYLRQEQLVIDARYYKGSSGGYYQSVDNIPVLSTYDDVEKLVKNEKVCILLTTDFRHTGLYITGNDYSSLFGNLTTVQIRSLKILSNQE